MARAKLDPNKRIIVPTNKRTSLKGKPKNKHKRKSYSKYRGQGR